MGNIVFRQINKKDEGAYNNFVKEFTDAKEKFIPDNAFNKDLSFTDWLRKTRNISEGINLPDGWVPYTVYFLFNKDKNKIIGAIDIRHQLNDHLLKYSGNIGYGVVPSERRKGYASKMLKNALEICKRMGMKKVLITCDKKNIGSVKTILKNGGILENEFKNDDGKMRQRYWIKID